MRERRRDREENASRMKQRNLSGIEGEDREERMLFIKEIMKRIIGEEAEVVKSEERRGETGRWGILTEIEGKVERDYIYIYSRREEIRSIWEIGVDEDRTMEERKMMWMMVARRERKKGKKDGS